MSKKDWDEVIEAAVEQGWRVVEIKKGIRLLAPNGIGQVTVHRTPSDRKALDNIIGHMRREGDFRWPPEKR